MFRYYRAFSHDTKPEEPMTGCGREITAMTVCTNSPYYSLSVIDTGHNDIKKRSIFSLCCYVYEMSM